MDRNEVVTKLSEIFRKVFDDSSININENYTANDIDQWDSLSHMILITEIEHVFSIKFKLKELNRMRNVGDMVEMIHSKI